jgi:hypothetical protein
MSLPIFLFLTFSIAPIKGATLPHGQIVTRPANRSSITQNDCIATARTATRDFSLEANLSVS